MILKEGRFRVDVKKFFMIKTVRHGNTMPRGAVNLLSFKVFKVRLSGTLSTLVK